MKLVSGSGIVARSRPGTSGSSLRVEGPRVRNVGQVQSFRARGEWEKFVRMGEICARDEFGAWNTFKVCASKGPSKALSDSRSAPIWRMVDGRRDVKPRPAAKGPQAPDLRAGLAETSGCVGLRSLYLRVTSMRSPKNGCSGAWKFGRLSLRQMASIGRVIFESTRIGSARGPPRSATACAGIWPARCAGL